MYFTDNATKDVIGYVYELYSVYYIALLKIDFTITFVLLENRLIPFPLLFKN